MRRKNQKIRTRQQRQQMRAHQRSMLLITGVLMLLTVIVSVGGVSLTSKNTDYKKQELALQTQIKEEQNRTREIQEYKDYVGTDEFVEDAARETFGLVHDGEILLKPSK